MSEQRKLAGLRAYIDELIGQGWVIASREPLSLRRGHSMLNYRNGMLLGG
ncbi:MAG: hypothetical protein GAK45_02331 [Pseudomonas citronellolis]|nr:MAG: hypothetical protein GAK45_02331 [Pseudomonas citronellolis]